MNSTPQFPAWQPIETAPKDGTWILLGGGQTKIPFVAKWKKPDEDMPSSHKWISFGMRSHEKCATHWMPLPEAPE